MLFLFQNLNETVGRGAYFNPTMDVLLYMLIATTLATIAWWFWQKKDKVKIEALEKQLHIVKPKLDVLNNEHEHLKAEHKEVKVGLTEIVSKYQGLKSQHQSFVSLHNTAKAQYEQADEERQSLLDSYESMETNFNALDIKYNNAVTTLDRLEEEIDNIKDERAELKLVNTHLRTEIKKLESLLDEEGVSLGTEEIKGNYQIDASQEEDEIERLIGASKAQSFIHNSDSKSEETIIQLQAEKDNLQAVYDALKEDYNQIRNEHTKLSNQYQELQSTHNQLVEKSKVIKVVPTNDFKVEKEALINKLAKIRIEHIQLKKEHEILKDEYNNSVLPKLKTSQELLSKKEESFKILESKLQEQNTKFQTSNNQLKNFEGLQATNQALYTNNKVLNDSHLELQSKYDTLSGEYTGLKSQFQLLRERYSAIEKELEANNSTTNIGIDPEYEQLKKDFNYLQIELNSTVEKQNLKQAELDKMTNLLTAIKESSNYGIIYLPTNLQVIEGIGPKIEVVLNKAKILNWEDVANTNGDSLKIILKEAGRRFIMHDPTSWPEQAQLLVQGKWKAFRDLEAKLIGGKKAKTQDADDLKIIEGIGPKIEVLLNNAKIHSWKKLSKTGIGELRRILKAGGSSYQVHDPSSWPEQAKLAAAWDWTALETLQEELMGGRLEA